LKKGLSVEGGNIVRNPNQPLQRRPFQRCLR
jgi:hypothetical protein